MTPEEQAKRLGVGRSPAGWADSGDYHMTHRWICECATVNELQEFIAFSAKTTGEGIALRETALMQIKSLKIDQAQADAEIRAEKRHAEIKAALKPHWTLTPVFWVVLAAAVFGLISILPLVVPWVRRVFSR